MPEVRMNDDSPGGLAQTEQPSTADAAGALKAMDLRAMRHFRSTARAAGGVLDLVMPMRVDGERPPLFFAHPLIGLSWCYLALLPHAGTGYPIYGLQARGLRRPEPLPTSMTEMARDYADQIRRVQPTGPYHLSGWSLGGNVAFAIAEELERRGEEVGLLAILDTDLTEIEAIPRSNEPWIVYNIVLAQFGYVPALTAADSTPEAQMLELVRRQPGLGLDDWPERRLRAMQRVIKNNIQVACSHQPGRVHCPLLLFSAIRNPPTLAEKVERWRLFVDGPVETLELDCDHRYILMPKQVTRIGPVLAERMARAAAGPVAIV
jgi:thioesterase domain-containing protein